MTSDRSRLAPLRCEVCGGQMKLVRKLSSTGAEAQLATYQCLHCGHFENRPVEEERRR